MKISCAFAPAIATPDHVVLAEELGYERAWLYDSPALYVDTWATLALAATRTERIGLATGIAVPGLRHVVTTAAAVRTITALAPDRFTLGIGSGGTGMMLIGSRSGKWAEIRAYAAAVRALVRGEDVDWEGRVLRVDHPELISPHGPVDVPLVIAAEGPKGEAAARELADGIFTIFYEPQERFDWSCKLIQGTVLEPGEDPASDRVFAAAAPGAAPMYHYTYTSGRREMLSQLPGGDAMAAALDEVPDAERVLATWAGHMVHPNRFDAEFIPRAAVAQLTYTAEADAIRARVDALADAGATEVVYQPCGPDIERELRAFKAAVG